MYDMDNFAKRIQALRKAKGLSQEELAGRLGVTAQAVSKWENAQSYPDITTVPTVAAILDVSVDELFGKRPEEQSHTFPADYEGLPMVHSHGNTACYSSKTAVSADDGRVTFADGSTAELSSRLARNTGKGEIKFLVSGDRAEADYSEESAHYEFPYADRLDIEVAGGRCEIVKADDGMTRVDLSGAGWFVRHHRVSVIDSILSVRFDGEQKVRSDHNRIRVALPCEKGKHARFQLNGGGGINAPLDFEGADLAVNGSGGIHTGRVKDCRAVVNGAGGIHFDGGGTVSLSINGSGDIDTGDVTELNIQISGSGDVSAESAGSLRAQISGSGDIRIGRIDGGNVLFQTNGAGDLHIGQGHCGLFEARLSGSGDADAEGVTARQADIVIEHNGSVRLGHVLEKSSEQIRKNGSITILRRGEP
ncbi:MAG: DUF2807 domain-containing protein [Oscillospiraceae bacterium]|nr:DUF2807 domain-containing protein [Oscillospiraceae bacterium]